jgi:DNA-directed RNA polymerase specialized sigma24 family protein
MWTVAHSVWIDHKRAAVTRCEVPSDPSLPIAEPADGRPLSHEIVHRKAWLARARLALAQVAGSARQLGVLRYWDRSAEEAASILGCSPGLVRKYRWVLATRIRDRSGELLALLATSPGW